VFEDRRDAGRQLAAQLRPLASELPIVVALPRGGVPVAVEVARALDAPLDVLMVRKLGAPGNPELGVGAVAEDDTTVLDAMMARRVGMTKTKLDRTLELEQRELRRRVARLRAGRAPVDVRGRTVIAVDDGLARGVTALAAVRALRRRGAVRIIVAAPVGSRQARSLLLEEADEVFLLSAPRELLGVGRAYRDFSPVSEEQVLVLLADAGAPVPAPDPVPLPDSRSA
jgi:predicted phosphoribosyltransferase